MSASFAERFSRKIQRQFGELLLLDIIGERYTFGELWRIIPVKLFEVKSRISSIFIGALEKQTFIACVVYCDSERTSEYNSDL